jgi:hypothetical protein
VTERNPVEAPVQLLEKRGFSDAILVGEPNSGTMKEGGIIGAGGQRSLLRRHRQVDREAIDASGSRVAQVPNGIGVGVMGVKS